MPYDLPTQASKLLHELTTDERLALPFQVVSLARSIRFNGASVPFLPVPWKFTEAISTLKGLEGAFAAFIAKQRFGNHFQPGSISINCDHAALFVFSAMSTTINDKSVYDSSVTTNLRDWDLHDSLKFRYRQLATNVYKTRDAKFFHLHGSLNATPSQKMIGIDPTRVDITDTDEILGIYGKAVAVFDASTLDTLANDQYRQAGTVCYTHEEFLKLEHGKAIEHVPIYELSPAGDQTATKVPWPPATSKKALSGIKVLELTRIIAGPAVGRGLAEHGATVLRITSDSLPDMHGLHLDLSQGKYNAFLDLKSDAGKQRLCELLQDADVIIDGYRPGCLERLGFGREAVKQIIGNRGGRGIVYVRENAYGWHGPWAGRSGWQQISDCLTGISWGFGQKQGLDEPVVPIFPNADYGTGVIGIIGTMHALYLRSVQGGSYNLDLSLSYYNVWLARQGFYPDAVWDQIKLKHPPFRHNYDMVMMLQTTIPILKDLRPDLFENPAFWQTVDAPAFHGTVRTLSPVVCFDGELRVGHERPPVQNGDDPAEWPTSS